MSDPTEVPDDLRYTADHEWIRVTDGVGQIGITAFAQDQLGDVVYLDLPDAGVELTAGERFGEIESVKTVSDLFSPVGGEVLERNAALKDHPELVNSDPYTEGWLLRVQLNGGELPEALLDAAAYTALIDAQPDLSSDPGGPA